MMRYTNCHSMGTQQISVDLAQNLPNVAPESIRFTDGATTITVMPVKVFQAIRRTIPLAYNGEEAKIMTIAVIRQMLNCGLKDAKDIVEYFFKHFERNAF